VKYEPFALSLTCSELDEGSKGFELLELFFVHGLIILAAGVVLSAETGLVHLHFAKIFNFFP
jgi:hypothetical protein